MFSSILRNWTGNEAGQEDGRRRSTASSAVVNEDHQSAGEDARMAGDRPDPRSNSSEAGVVHSNRVDLTEESTTSSKAKSKQNSERHCFSISGRIFQIDKKYKPLKKMGSGAYGIVITAMDEELKRKVAIKKVENVFDNLHDAKRILREVKLMQHFDHKNVLKLVDLLDPPRSESKLSLTGSKDEFTDMYIVTEAMQSDLHRIIYSDNVLSDEHTQYVIYQILCGLKHLHSCNVIHRDLKPANILINEDCSVKICDFGLSRGVSSQNKDELGALTEYVVTRWYRAPEVITAAQQYGYEIDIWSVGCIMAEIINREPLFQGNSYVDQLNTIFNVLGTPSESDLQSCTNAKAIRYINKLQRRAPVDLARVLPGASSKAVDLLSKMLVFDPRKRITVDDALNHPYFDTWRTTEDNRSTKGAFDFSFEETAITRPQLEDKLMGEIRRFRPVLDNGDSTAQEPETTTSHRKPSEGTTNKSTTKRQ